MLIERLRDLFVSRYEDDQESGTPGERTGMLRGDAKREPATTTPAFPRWFLAGLLALGLLVVLALVAFTTGAPLQSSPPPPIGQYVPAVSMLPAPVSRGDTGSYSYGPAYDARPLVRVIGTGGTIAGQQDNPGTLGGYHSGAISADAVVQSVPEIATFATVESENFLNVGSPSILPSDWLALAQKINRYFAEVYNRYHSSFDGLTHVHETVMLLHCKLLVAHRERSASSNPRKKPTGPNTRRLCCDTRHGPADRNCILPLLDNQRSSSSCARWCTATCNRCAV